MSSIQTDIEQFFADFEEAGQGEQWERYGDLFLPQFLNLDPALSGMVARDDLIAFLPHRKAIFEKAGATQTTLTALEVEALDPQHAQARTTWKVLFDYEREPVYLRTTFLLRREDRWRIAVYLNHGSLLELLGLASS
jgi:hypothetical protein